MLVRPASGWSLGVYECCMFPDMVLEYNVNVSKVSTEVK